MGDNQGKPSALIMDINPKGIKTMKPMTYITLGGKILCLDHD
jgi:hypothetical protein